MDDSTGPLARNLKLDSNQGDFLVVGARENPLSDVAISCTFPPTCFPNSAHAVSARTITFFYVMAGTNNFNICIRVSQRPPPPQYVYSYCSRSRG